MDRDREANTRCTWFTQIGYVHGVEEFSLIMKGSHKYIGSSSHLVSTNVASSLEVLFLHPGVVSLTDEDAQGVPQVAELGDLPNEVTDKVNVVFSLEVEDVEDEYPRAMSGKNKAKGKDREKA
ncbi:hypothetical protein ACFX1R_031493 [Malus domestica]